MYKLTPIVSGKIDIERRIALFYDSLFTMLSTVLSAMSLALWALKWAGQFSAQDVGACRKLQRQKYLNTHKDLKSELKRKLAIPTPISSSYTNLLKAGIVL